MKKHTSLDIGPVTAEQIRFLREKYDCNQSEAVIIAVNRLYQECLRNGDPKYLAAELLDRFNEIMERLAQC